MSISTRIVTLAVLLISKVNSLEFIRIAQPIISTTWGSTIVVEQVIRERHAYKWYYKGNELAENSEKYSVSNDEWFSRSCTIKNFSVDDIGNYTGKWGDAGSQKKWIYGVQTNSFTYKAKVGSPLKLDTCASSDDVIISMDCAKTNTPSTSDVKDRITISEDKKSMTISTYREEYTGTYKCNIQYPYNVIEYNFVLETTSETPTVRSCSAQGNTHSIKIFGAIEDNEKAVPYHPSMNELNSETHKTFEEKICKLLHNSRIDELLKPTFHVSCGLIEVHPISSEFVVLLKIHDEHLKYLGFEMNRDGAIKAIQSIYARHASRGPTVFYFKTLSQEVENKMDYLTVFVEGVIYVDRKKVEYKPDYDKWDGEELQKLDEKTCELIEIWRMEDVLLHKHPIACSVYAMDLDSKLVVQLSVYRKDMKELGIPIDESSLRQTVSDWIERGSELYKDVGYLPYVRTPAVNAFWTSETPTATLRSVDFQQYVNWFYSTYTKYLGQVKPFEFVYNSKSNDQVVTSLFSSSKELLKAGMIIRRQYAKILAQPKEQPRSTFVYTIKDLKTQTMVQRRTLGTRDRLMTMLYTKKLEQLAQQDVLHSTKFCKQIRLSHQKPEEKVFHECKILHYNLSELTVTFILMVPQQGLTYYAPYDISVVWID